ncbi:MAG: hypothetical protein JXA21_24740 [Anaerolineae bacterium]|nr:hypothetical protein [Anaerolineae bacterium]
MNQRAFLKIAAISATIAIALLFVLAGMAMRFQYAFPGEDIFTGRVTPTAAEFARHVAGVQAYYAADALFIISDTIAWLGLAVLVRSRQPVLGNVVLGLSLAGGLLDFIENEMVLALLSIPQAKIAEHLGWYLAWRTVQRFSYMILFSAAAVAAVGLWSRKPLDRAVALIGTGLLAITIVAFYNPALYIASNVWWLVWIAGAGVLLWRRAAEWPEQELPSNSP